MNGEPIQDDSIPKVDAALTQVLGMHGPWVLAIETYAEDGEQRLSVMWDSQSTAWTRLGMAHALTADIEVPFRERGDKP